jgi:hypothetical protein
MYESMNKEDCQYYLACSLLGAVFSVYYEIDELCVVQEGDELPPDWYSFVEGPCANWENHQGFSTNCSQKQPRNDYTIYQFCDLIAGKGIKEVRIMVTHWQEMLPFINERELFWYLYCRWVLTVLREFEDVVGEVGAALPQVYRSYQDARPMFGELIRLIHIHLSQLAIEKKVPESMFDEWQYAIDRLTLELALMWRDTVYSAADNLRTRYMTGNGND